MSATEKATSGGFPILGVTFIVFLILKLAEVGAVADWSWWWVTAPLWGGFALLLGIILLIGIISAFGRSGLMG